MYQNIEVLISNVYTLLILKQNQSRKAFTIHKYIKFIAKHLQDEIPRFNTEVHILSLRVRDKMKLKSLLFW